MYSLNQGKTFLHLAEDLNLLEFGSGKSASGHRRRSSSTGRESRSRRTT